MEDNGTEDDDTDDSDIDEDDSQTQVKNEGVDTTVVVNQLQ